MLNNKSIYLSLISELFGGGVPTPESWAWQSIFQNLWVVWCWSLPELMAIDGN